MVKNLLISDMLRVFLLLEAIMKVHSIFDSLQGEGRFQGFPTQFVRLHGCNLRCSYCDAKSAVSGNVFEEIPVDEIIKSITNSDMYDLCITGGEPFCQKDELIKLLSGINNKRISIETNGSFDVTKVGELFPEVFFSIDWKTPSSGSTSFKMGNLEFLENGQGWIKFVIGDLSDLEFVVKKLKFLDDIEVFLSPVFEEGVELFGEIAKFIMAHKNMRMQIQMHKILKIE